MSCKIMLGTVLIVAAFIGAITITKLNIGQEEVPITPGPTPPAPSGDCPWVWDNANGIVKFNAGNPLYVMDWNTGEYVDAGVTEDLYFTKEYGTTPNYYMVETLQSMYLDSASVTAAAYPVTKNNYFPFAESVTATSPNNYGMTITKTDGTKVQAKCAWYDYDGKTINGINLEKSVYPGGASVGGSTFFHRTRFDKSYWGGNTSPWSRTWDMTFGSQYIDAVDSHTIHQTITIRSTVDDSIVETLADRDITTTETSDYFYPPDILGIRQLTDTEYLVVDFSFVLNASAILDARTANVTFSFRDGGTSTADIMDEREWGGGFMLQLFAGSLDRDPVDFNGFFVFDANGNITGWKKTLDGEVIVSEGTLEIPATE